MMDWFGEGFKEGFVNFCIWMTHGLFNTLYPFVEWGCKILIVWCVVTYYCSQDKGSISLGLKAFLLYVLFMMLGGALGV